MFDIGWSELMVIAVVALVVIGPKDLPQAIYGIGKWVRKARLVARDFQGHVDDMMREAELDDLRKQALKARDLNIKQMVEDQLDPKGELKKAFEMPAEMTGAIGHPGSPAEDVPPAEAAVLPPSPAEAAPAEAPKAVADSVVVAADSGAASAPQPATDKTS
jgi:sec-independent protein translocase protein TatB